MRALRCTVGLNSEKNGTPTWTALGCAASEPIAQVQSSGVQLMASLSITVSSCSGSSVSSLRKEQCPTASQPLSHTGMADQSA